MLKKFTTLIFCLIFSGSVFSQNQPVQHRSIFVPNAFTPNGDGLNDVFKMVNVRNEQLLEFKVFNRWGTILFSTKDAQEGWDGTFRQNMQPYGVYGYVIRIKYPDNIIETYKGTVTLIR